MQRESSIHASGGGEAGLLSAILRSLATVAMCSQCCALRIRLEARILSEVSTGDSGAKEFPRWRFLKLRFLYKHEARASESHWISTHWWQHQVGNRNSLACASCLCMLMKRVSGTQKRNSKTGASGQGWTRAAFRAGMLGVMQCEKGSLQGTDVGSW